jgi:hypothetical protein
MGDSKIQVKKCNALEETNSMHRLYHSFILRTGSYMFRQ